MIYKATPIQAHRVEFSSAENQFIPTSSFGSTLSDFRVLSQINEDQSTMHQYPGGNLTSSTRTMIMPYTPLNAPFVEQPITAEQPRAPSVALSPPSSSYDSSYIPSDMSVGAFGTVSKAYEISTPDFPYGSFTSPSPAASAFFHPPMLLPLQHCSSPPAASPIPSISPGPSPRKQELQIRMSQPCYEMGQHHHEILPLETNPFKK
jgi:hypothetical protein